MQKLKKTKIFTFFIYLFAFCFLIFDFSAPAAAQDDDSATGSSIRDLVREKVKEKLNGLTADQPQAVIGTIQKISDHSIEIKSVDGKIQLAGTTDETKIFRVTKGKRTEIKFADLALDENVIAMGYKNFQGVLDTKRVITSDEPPLENNKQTAYGQVKIIGKNTLTVKHLRKDEERSIKVSSRTDITGKEDDERIVDIIFADIKVEDRAVVVGTPDSTGVLTATRIHVIPGEAKGLDKPTPTPSKKQPTATPAP